MGFEPQKFFVGLIDFFSVWLPGALLVYLVKDDVSPLLVAQGYKLPGEPVEAWAVFLFTAYLVGHLVFVIGSIVMDRIDKRVRKAAETPALAAERPISGRLADWLFDDQSRRALDWASKLKDGRLESENATGTINTYQWAKARLAIAHAEPLAIVHRFEADSKFFRSLCIVLVVLAAWSVPTRHWVTLAGSLAFLPFAVWRFMELRAKATEQAYWFVITLETSPPPPAPAPQAGSSSA